MSESNELHHIINHRHTEYHRRYEQNWIKAIYFSEDRDKSCWTSSLELSAHKGGNISLQQRIVKWSRFKWGICFLLVLALFFIYFNYSVLSDIIPDKKYSDFFVVFTNENNSSFNLVFLIFFYDILLLYLYHVFIYLQVNNVLPVVELIFSIFFLENLFSLVFEIFNMVSLCKSGITLRPKGLLYLAGLQFAFNYNSF